MTKAAARYQGRRAILATMHGKETAIAPAMQDALGLLVEPLAGLDTDVFGTFDRRVPRLRPMMETALAKARAGMALSNKCLGIASEGSYGPHPAITFLPGGLELMVFVDDQEGFVVSEHLIEDEPYYASCVVAPEQDLSQFFMFAGFPRHAVMVAPASSPTIHVAKGLRDGEAARRAIAACAEHSQDGLALVVNDMRAFLNPTRMRTIERLARKLATRILSTCPRCATPGFGRTDVVKQFACELCGAPTIVPSHDVHGCAYCGLTELHERPAAMGSSSPQNCPICNP